MGESRRGEIRKLWIEGQDGRLEAALRAACPARAAAVLAHPHPQHGGTLHNPVVFHADRELHRAGFTTLRFNFRGVGTSEGSFDDGRGEVDDVAAAVSWLRGITLGLPMLLVGYSFGSLTGLRHALTDDSIAAFLAIGLPAGRYEVTGLEGLRRPLAVVQAADDEFGLPSDVQPLLEAADPAGKLYVVDGTTHLFPGRATDAATQVVAAARDLLGL